MGNHLEVLSSVCQPAPPYPHRAHSTWWAYPVVLIYPNSPGYRTDAGHLSILVGGTKTRPPSSRRCREPYVQANAVDSVNEIEPTQVGVPPYIPRDPTQHTTL